MIEMATFLHLPGPHIRLNAVTEAGFPIPCLRLTTAAAAADVPVLAVSNGTVIRLKHSDGGYPYNHILVEYASAVSSSCTMCCYLFC